MDAEKMVLWEAEHWADASPWAHQQLSIIHHSYAAWSGLLQGAPRCLAGQYWWLLIWWNCLGWEEFVFCSTGKVGCPTWSREVIEREKSSYGPYVWTERLALV